VVDLVCEASAQYEASAAMHERYCSPVVLSAMDLSVEAEAFGAEVHFEPHDVPTVAQPVLRSTAEVSDVMVPEPGEKRTGIYLEVVRRLKRLSGNPLVMGGCIGPFSLAGRLVGVSEALLLTVTEPRVLEALIEKCASFLQSYVTAFRLAGADGVIMAEPSAGLLSPSALATFSSRHVRRIVESTPRETFSFVLHNCAARLVHLPAVLGAGAHILHFGAPMDLPAALEAVNAECVLCGNLDPAGVFCQDDPRIVEDQTTRLLCATAQFPNYVVSSGCDLPPRAGLSGLDAFYRAVSESKPWKVAEDPASGRAG
jgi:uroporphyrinogen decarboxylase